MQNIRPYFNSVLYKPQPDPAVEFRAVTQNNQNFGKKNYIWIFANMPPAEKSIAREDGARTVLLVSKRRGLCAEARKSAKHWGPRQRGNGAERQRGGSIGGTMKRSCATLTSSPASPLSSLPPPPPPPAAATPPHATSTPRASSRACSAETARCSGQRKLVRVAKSS